MIPRFAKILMAAVFAVVAAGCSMTNPLASKDQVVFQVSADDAKTWNLALNNAKNVQSAKGTAAEIEIVVYGPGIEDFIHRKKPGATFEITEPRTISFGMGEDGVVRFRHHWELRE